MTTLTYPNFVVDGEDKLLSQFKDKPVFRSIMLSALESLQQTQEFLVAYASINNLEDGVGTILDVIGKIVGESRLGRTDTSYKEALYSRIVINTSEGTPNQLLEILTLLSKGTKYKIYEHYPLTTAFYTNGSASDNMAITLTTASPITSDDVSIYHDPDDNAFIPSELGLGLSDLSTQDDDIYTDDNGNTIQVTQLLTTIAEDWEKGVLPEIGELDETTRIPCEMYTRRNNE